MVITQGFGMEQRMRFTVDGQSEKRSDQRHRTPNKTTWPADFEPVHSLSGAEF